MELGQVLPPNLIYALEAVVVACPSALPQPMWQRLKSAYASMGQRLGKDLTVAMLMYEA